MIAQSLQPNAEKLLQKINQQQARVGIVGLGYVGLPLAIAFCHKGYHTTGIDIDQRKIQQLNENTSYIHHIHSKEIADLNRTDRFKATADMRAIGECDVIIMCVPTPLTKQRDPDMKFIEQTTQAISQHMAGNPLVVLESSTYPGTTFEIVKPILETKKRQSQQDFFLAYSPEREDPGNIDFSTTDIPKVVGGDGFDALTLAIALYDQVVSATIPVSSTQTAEAVKLTENIFRAINIALVNELKIIFKTMDVDIWEVIDAAKTKPFGFMPFYPGPGLGGHCIPIDPFYLTWKAREYGIPTRFIELAGEINTFMPRYVVSQLSNALNDKFAKAIKGSKILLMGLAYKKNVDDTRESPSFSIYEILQKKGAQVSFYDPFVPSIPKLREYPDLAGQPSIDFNKQAIAKHDAAVICTDHDDVDYAFLAQHCPLIIDTRNAYAKHGLTFEHVIKS